MTDKDKREKISFEEALAKLEEIVTQIEQGKISLEESIARYAQGMEMVKTCRSILDAAEKKIQLLAKNQNGSPVVEGELPEQDAE